MLRSLFGKKTITVRKILGPYLQEDEEEVVLATRLAVHGPILGPQASFPGISGPLATGLTDPIMVPNVRISPNDPTGPVMVL